MSSPEIDTNTCLESTSDQNKNITNEDLSAENEIIKNKLGDIDGLSSDTDTDIILHGQQTIEGLEYDDDLGLSVTLSNSNTVHNRSVYNHLTPVASLVGSIQASPVSNTKESHDSFSKDEHLDLHVESLNFNDNISQLKSDSISLQLSNDHRISSMPKESTPKVNLKNQQIPSRNQIHELASNIGFAFEPLTHELDPKKLENLIKQLTPIISLLESTAELCGDLKNNEQHLLIENNKLSNELKQLKLDFESNEFGYQATINTLSDQLEMFQVKIDNKSSDWDFEETQVSHVEENLAIALKEAQNKIEEMQQSSFERRRKTAEKQAFTSEKEGEVLKESKIKLNHDEGIENSEINGPPHNSPHLASSSSKKPENISTDEIANQEKEQNLLELNQIIQQKNYYKEKCFALEDELRELRGQKHETLLSVNQESESSSSISTFFKKFSNRKSLN